MEALISYDTQGIRSEFHHQICPLTVPQARDLLAREVAEAM